MATVQEKRKAFRDILTSSGGETAPSAYDAMSAMLIERAGFKAVHISGSGVHRSSAMGDVGLLSLTEQVARATIIADAVNVPVIGDAETGHGNVVNLVRAVREFERSGVAAIHIEDQETPKRPTYEGLEGGFISTAEFVGKIKAAVDTRTDPNFVIIARMDARPQTYEQAIERAVKAAEAGADALWVGVSGDDELRQVVKDVPKPMVGIPRRPRVTSYQYIEMGYKVAIVPSTLAQAACWAMSGVLQELKEKGQEADYFASLKGADEMRAWFNAIGVESTKELEGKYMS
jgi:2-methylisocitrate lyase-like PEP mutase family enzyme